MSWLCVRVQEMARIEKQLEVLSADRDRLIKKQQQVMATEVEMMPLEKEVQAIVPVCWDHLK